jgi:hypothetical protein
LDVANLTGIMITSSFFDGKLRGTAFQGPVGRLCLTSADSCRQDRHRLKPLADLTSAKLASVLIPVGMGQPMSAQPADGASERSEDEKKK